MSESTIADFVAEFIPDGHTESEPVRGRVVMSPRRLVLATGEERTVIPLESIFDVAVGQAPPDVSEFFDDTVTIAYRPDEERRLAVVQGGAETIDRFTAVLFKAILSGTPATVKHPASVGGRVLDTPPREATLKLGDRAVTFVGLDDPFTIDLSAVVDFDRDERTIEDDPHPALRVRHTTEGRAMTSEVVLPSSRKMNALGRYLRLEYEEIAAEVRELSIPDSEMEALVALYSSDGDVNLARLLGIDASNVTLLLDSLEEKGLVARTEEGPSLTSKGRMAANERIEHVNL